MIKTLPYRIVSLAAGFGLALSCTAAKAPAALDMFVGAKKVVENQPVSACNAAAKSALDGVLQNSLALGGSTSGEWEGYAPAVTADGTTAVASIHCFPVGTGYVVEFTCAAQVPPNADSASALCAKLSAAFDAK